MIAIFIITIIMQTVDLTHKQINFDYFTRNNILFTNYDIKTKHLRAIHIYPAVKQILR